MLHGTEFARLSSRKCKEPIIMAKIIDGTKLIKIVVNGLVRLRLCLKRIGDDKKEIGRYCKTLEKIFLVKLFLI